MDLSQHYVYDLETYPNCFTACFVKGDSSQSYIFEISQFKDDSTQLYQFLTQLQQNKTIGIGFNNIGFDYPILHMFMQAGGRIGYGAIYQKAQAIIKSQYEEEDVWSHTVYSNNRFFPQLDLFKLNHFDNKAKATSLKALEFAMRSDNISDLPFPVGTYLNENQIKVLRDYNLHDVKETLTFANKCKGAIDFRETLSLRYDRDFMNHSDAKLGSDYFIMELENRGFACYDYSPAKGRTPRQTKRSHISLNEAIFDWIDFEITEFKAVANWLRAKTIVETKGVFTDIPSNELSSELKHFVPLKNTPKKGEHAPNLQVCVGGIWFVFGTGGIHGSLEGQDVLSDDETCIADYDVASYYPNLAIKNRIYPAHYDEAFCDIYEDVYEMRKRYTKAQPENGMLKLALNATYGNSNNKFSVFYDPLYTMTITLNGQLLLCLLAEKLLLGVESLRMVQVNTDGLTIKCNREDLGKVRFITWWWQQKTKLELEENLYSRMILRDVNNYIAVYEKSGKAKRKGAYEWEKEWHKDHSALVVPKIAAEVLINGGNIRELIMAHEDKMDFMLRIKVPRNSQLVLEKDSVDVQIQNTTRYYVSNQGYPMYKLMPPTKRMIDEGISDWRRTSVQSGWKVWECNNINDATAPIDYDYYVEMVERLVLAIE